MITASPESEVIPEQLPLVERYARHPVSSLETYTYFNQTEQAFMASRDQFIDAVVMGLPMDAPVFSYPLIDVDALLVTRDELTEMLSELPIDRQLTMPERITRENIVNRLDEVSLMMLVKMQSELDENDPRYEDVSAQLGLNMREIYGAPNEQHFKEILGYRLSMLEEVLSGIADNPESVQEAIAYLRANLPNNLPMQPPKQIDPEVAGWYMVELKRRTGAGMALVNAALDSGDLVVGDDKRLDADNICRATRILLDERGATRWKVEKTTGTGIHTSQAELTVFIPEKRRMSVLELEAVIASHEIDKHVMTRENGDRSGQPELGGVGMQGYLAKEEGTGKINEGLVRGKLSLEASAYGYFLSGGLAYGFDRGGEGRNFRQLTEIIWRFTFVEGYIKRRHEADDGEIRASIDKAVTHLVRLFRGTNGKVPGVIFPKDATTYYEGAADVVDKWTHDFQSLNEEDRRFTHTVERAAKHDITRADHARFVAECLALNPYEVR